MPLKRYQMAILLIAIFGSMFCVLILGQIGFYIAILALFSALALSLFG